MKILRDTLKNTGTLHHAYIIEGEKALVREKIFSFIEDKLEHSIQGNPDFWHEVFETLSIDDARRLRGMQLLKPIAHQRKIFVIEVFGMTIEAQNALLKMFEEPTQDTHFFLLTDSADIFLPTLRSRMIVISDIKYARGEKAGIKKFLSLGPAERLKIIAPIIEVKDKTQAVELVDGLIGELSQSQEKNQKYATRLKELLTLRSYLNDRSPSLKLILEHISLILPII